MTHYVLVYGTLRKGHSNHRLLHNAEYVDTRILPLPFVMKHLGGFPGLLPGLHTDNKITCELYRVTDTTFQSLDYLEGYPSFYNRTLIEVGIDDETERYVDAWIYYLEDEEYYQHYPEIESGDWDDAGSVYSMRTA